MIKINYPFIILNTKNTALIFEIKKHADVRSTFNQDKFYVSQRYYGPLKDVPVLNPTSPLVGTSGSNDDYNLDFLITNTFGDGNQNNPSIIIDSEIESFTNRFYFKEAKILEKELILSGPHTRDIEETLDIIETDEESHLELHHYYSLLSYSDIIVSKNELINKGEAIKINKIVSLQLPLVHNDLTIFTFDGAWAFERTRHSLHIENGIFEIDSKIGSSGAKHNPFFEIKDNKNNLYYGFNFIYSGNHKETVETSEINNKAYIQIGINDFLFSLELKSNESFITPEAVMVVSEDLDEITSSMHKFAINHIVRKEYRHKLRPILFNSWEGTSFNINEESLYEMATISKDLGIDLFVVDDGWFKGRNNDHSSLGDWFEDPIKFPNGFSSFVKRIKGLGLKFGLWFEPEMINEKSDLFRNHPEFASIVPNRIPMPRRHQLIIDMSNPKVVDCLFNMMSKIIDDIKPDYIKWDYNRFMSDTYSNAGIKKGEYMYRFIEGTYSLIERLITKYPEILFESCSSGGCRYDLGMLYYMPQNWGSDDTNSYFRTFITCGTLTGYPQSSYGAHISKDGIVIPEISGSSNIEDRFNINCIGAFGYEFDVRKLSNEDKETIKKQIIFYKEHQELLQFGEYFVIDNCFDNPLYYSFIIISPNKEEAIMILVETKDKLVAKNYRMKGLDPNFIYEVIMREQSNIPPQKLFHKTIKGKDLMKNGINLGSLSLTEDGQIYKGINSRLLYLKRKHE